MPRSQRVSLCMIVRNEEGNLGDCLKPVRHLFDEVIVVDTGSTDRTVEIAESLGARVISSPWQDDFSLARNAGVAAATGDWIFWLDADDRVMPLHRQRLAELFDDLKSEPVAYVMACRCRVADDADGLIISQCRLFRRLPGILWERRVHEQIASNLERVGHTFRHTRIEIEHIGYREPALRHRKANRDLRLLRMDYTLDPQDAATLYHMGLTQRKIGNHEGALSSFLLGLKYVRSQGDWVRGLYAAASECCGQLGRHEDAASIAKQGLEVFPRDTALLTILANSLCQLGDLGGAERLLLRAVAYPADEIFLCHDATMANGQQALVMLGWVYCDQGRYLEAERVLQEVLASRPDFVQAWCGLAYLYIFQNRWESVEEVSRQLDKCDRTGVYRDVVRAESLSAQKMYEPARSLLESAMERAPQLLWPRVALATLLVETGADVATCRAAQHEVLRLAPGNKVALANLKRLEQRSTQTEPVSTFQWTFTT